MSRPWGATLALGLVLLAAGAATASGATDPIPAPTAMTLKAYGVEGTEVVLSGSINPQGREAHFRFQWGRTRSYGHFDPRYIEEYFGGDEDREVEEVIECLRPRTTYHYRVVAYGPGGRGFGADRTFRTTGLDGSPKILYRYCPGHRAVE